MLLGVADMQVYAGNAGPFLHGCIRYQTTDMTTALYDSTHVDQRGTPDSSTVRHEIDVVGLAVGLAVGLSVLIILLIIIIIIIAVVIYKRRGREKQIIDRVEMPTVSTEHPLTEEPHAQR